MLLLSLLCKSKFMELQNIDLQKTRCIRLQTCKGAGLRHGLGLTVQAAGLRDGRRSGSENRGQTGATRLAGVRWPRMVVTSVRPRPCEVPARWSVRVRIRV